jgi:hypothetical protein
MFKIKFFPLFFLFVIFFTISAITSHLSLYLNPADSPLPAENSCDQILPFLAEVTEFESDTDDDFAKLHSSSPLLDTTHVRWLPYSNQIDIFKHLKFRHILPRSPPTIILSFTKFI